MTRKVLDLLIHGDPGMGKTPISLTTPAPRLVLDVEGGAVFASAGAGGVEWDLQGTAPDAETVRVFVNSFDTLSRAYSYLTKEKHPFRSLTIDSVTETQRRCKDALGAQAFQGKSAQQDWGTLLIRMEKLMRAYRDAMNAGSFDVLCLTATTDLVKGLYRPAVQGGLATSLPGFVSVVGYLGVFRDLDNQRYRGMMIQSDGEHIAKDRTASLPNGGLTARYGDIIPAPINISDLVSNLYA